MPTHAWVVAAESTSFEARPWHLQACLELLYGSVEQVNKIYLLPEDRINEIMPVGYFKGQHMKVSLQGLLHCGGKS